MSLRVLWLSWCVLLSFVFKFKEQNEPAFIRFKYIHVPVRFDYTRAEYNKTFYDRKLRLSAIS
jgi:hypothetical protein